MSSHPAPLGGHTDPEPGLYLHNATASFYVVLDVATCSTNGPRDRAERSVIYWSASRRELFYREVGEFMTPGRFTRVDKAAKS